MALRWTAFSRSSARRKSSSGGLMPKIWVYAELSQAKLQPTALELMARARELGDVEAVALGTGARAAGATLGKHGAKVVHVNEDKAFDDFIAEPATDALVALHKQNPPDLILFGFTSDSRDVAGRLPRGSVSDSSPTLVTSMPRMAAWWPRCPTSAARRSPRCGPTRSRRSFSSGPNPSKLLRPAGPRRSRISTLRSAQIPSGLTSSNGSSKPPRRSSSKTRRS